jgi:hypothetical protein
MSAVPQSKFTLTLATTDNANPPNQLVAGEVTQLDFVINGTTYSWPLPAATAPGAVVTVPFTALTPAFSPTPGAAYSADVFEVDANGNGTPSNSVSWTQTAAPTPPAAPTNFGVS